MRYFIRLLYILLLVGANHICAIAQPIGQPKTEVRALGGLTADSIFKPPFYADTNIANIRAGKKSRSLITTVVAGDTVFAGYDGRGWKVLAATGGGAAGNLQQVTDNGNTTTNKITVLDVDFDTIPGYSAARAAANLFAKNDSVKFAFCILRPVIDGGGNITWSLLTDADHMPLRFTSLSYGSGPIMTVSFANPTAVKILTCHVTPDETLANYGVTSGAKANLTNIQIELSWPKGNWAGLMFRDSTNTWRFSPNIASSQVIEYAPNGFEWVETSSSQMGGKINAISDYQGMVSAGYHYTYAGTSGYRLVKAQNFPYYLQKRMQLVDAYGNAVPLTALTHLDMIQVNSNRSFQMNPQWNYNIWNLFSAPSNLWVTLVYK